ALDVGSFCPVCRQQVKHVDTGCLSWMSSSWAVGTGLWAFAPEIEAQRNEHIGIDSRKPVQASIPVLQKVELDCVERNCSSVCFESNYTGVVECQNEFDWDTCRSSPKMYVCFELWQEGLRVKEQCESSQCFLGDVDAAEVTYRASQLALLLSFLAAASCSCFKKRACNCRGAQVYTRQALLAVGNCCLVPSMLMVLLYFVLPRSFFYPPSYAFVGVPIELFVTVPLV
ncbi:unnamed protein product, partial [Symbiodinium microadriaticum]